MIDFEKLQPEKILFLDIETVPYYSNFREVPERVQKLWDTKSNYFRKEDETPEDVYRRAGIYAEFGKIICISAGYIQPKEGKHFFRIKSFFGHDESLVLSQFKSLLDSSFQSKNHLLCAHNGKEFDFPFLCRRYLINNIKLPTILNISGKKPWEVKHLDTMEMWKFGDYKNYTSLELLATVFNIETPKDDITGADVWRVYWEEKNLDRIVEYCQKDVITVAQIFLRMQSLDTIEKNNIIYT